MNIDAIYSKYEKLMPREKLPEFLFEYFHRFDKVPWVTNTEEGSFYRALQSTAKEYRQQKFLTDFLDRIFLTYYSKKKSSRNRKKILFRPFKYYNIILEAKKHHQVGLFVHGNYDRLFALRHGMGYVATSDLDQYVLAYLEQKDITCLYRLINAVEKKLVSAKPDYIVLWTDILPIERTIALVAKKLGIATLEIQHGLEDSFWPIESGKVVDYVLVWGRYFIDLYAKQNIRKPQDLYTVGYPYVSPNNPGTVKHHNPYVVYYLGANLEVYNDAFLNVKVQTIKKLDEICKALGMPFFYRPHPGDDRELLQKHLPGISFTNPSEGLQEAFTCADIFISFQSSALVESSMRSKVSLQLLNYPIESDNFEKLGVCSKSCVTIEALGDYLKKIVDAKNLDAFKIKFNNGYVETRYNPAERFLEIIQEIEKKHKK